MSEEEIVRVASAEAMDKGTFAKHFTKRHHAYLAGQTRLPGTVSDAVMAAYRAYHRRIHQMEELEHEHEQES